MPSDKSIGILALQGSFAEHARVLETLGVGYRFVRSSEDLKGLSHLILPGGESTTLRKLLKAFGMWETLKIALQKKQLKVLATCAGAIVCQDFGLQAQVQRNAYGGQMDSFTDRIDSERFGPLEGVFIRAPKFSRVHHSVKVLAKRGDEPVMLEQGNILALSFHPELTGETRVHEYFLHR